MVLMFAWQAPTAHQASSGATPIEDGFLVPGFAAQAPSLAPAL